MEQEGDRAVRSRKKEKETESAAIILEHIRLTVGFSKQKVLTYKKKSRVFKIFLYSSPLLKDNAGFGEILVQSTKYSTRKLYFPSTLLIRCWERRN